MSYLIDTQIIIWFLLEDSKLSPAIYAKLTDNENSIFVSQVSLFEIAIKQKIGKLPELSKPIDKLIELIENIDFGVLPIKNKHIVTYDSIPLFDNHKDWASPTLSTA